MLYMCEKDFRNDQQKEFQRRIDSKIDQVTHKVDAIDDKFELWKISASWSTGIILFILVLILGKLYL